MEVSREVLKMYEAFRDLRWANSGKSKKEIAKSVGRTENNQKPLQVVCDGQAYKAKDTMK